MANEGYFQDAATNIVNVHWGIDVYVVITTFLAPYYAQLTADSDDSVKIIDTHTEGDKAGTLIECSADAGDNFVELITSLDADVAGGQMYVYAYVLPKTDDALANWKKVRPFLGFVEDDRAFPVGVPCLWVMAQFDVGKPTTISFKIQYVPHLIAPTEGQTNNMVQLYPTSGGTSWALSGGFIRSGWSTYGYRLDDDGVGTVYLTPASWATDQTLTVAGIPVPGNEGLDFGKDPPLISGDVPGS